MGKHKRSRRGNHWVPLITVWTFILAIVLGFIAQIILSAIYSLAVSFLILAAVILLGIFFDMIGTAAAAADLAPLNAKAARRVNGARRGVYLVQHADQVANFCNDVVGDISGIISGTLAAIIVLRLVAAWPSKQADLYAGIILTALVAALTVGGKAWGKTLAINRSTEVILFVGKVLNRLEKPFFWLSPEKRN
jgi:CBS domain containing-hemolysin-like protein